MFQGTANISPHILQFIVNPYNIEHYGSEQCNAVLVIWYESGPNP